MSMALQIFVFVLLILVVPLWVGGILTGTYRGRGNRMFRWIGGQFLLWAGFQIISVFLILKQESFSWLVILYWIFIAAMLILSTGAMLKQRAYGVDIRLIKKPVKRRFSNLILWLCVWGLLGIQLVQTILMNYADGDDAYYVAISAIAMDADSMYLKLPYTGGVTALDIRHGVAPFPMWIAFLADATGIQAVTMAQVVLPVALICMSYGIFYIIGNKLFPEKNGQLPLFLIFVEVLMLFGDYSVAGMESYMITVTHQGKAVLNGIVVPFLMCLCMMILHRLQKQEAVPGQLYLLLVCGTLTGCMCSGMGSLLMSVLLGIVGVLGAIVYRRPKLLLSLALSCIPCVYYALIYLIWG